MSKTIKRRVRKTAKGGRRQNKRQTGRYKRGGVGGLFGISRKQIENSYYIWDKPEIRAAYLLDKFTNSNNKRHRTLEKRDMEEIRNLATNLLPDKIRQLEQKYDRLKERGNWDQIGTNVKTIAVLNQRIDELGQLLSTAAV